MRRSTTASARSSARSSGGGYGTTRSSSSRGVCVVCVRARACLFFIDLTTSPLRWYAEFCNNLASQSVGDTSGVLCNESINLTRRTRLVCSAFRDERQRRPAQRHRLERGLKLAAARRQGRLLRPVYLTVTLTVEAPIPQLTCHLYLRQGRLLRGRRPRNRAPPPSRQRGDARGARRGAVLRRGLRRRRCVADSLSSGAARSSIVASSA